MQQFFLDSFRKSFSETRLRPYRINSYDPGCLIVNHDADVVTIARYLWNIKLCESFYLSLQNLEICLRNRIDHAIADLTGNTSWFLDRILLRDQERKRVNRVIRKIMKDRNKGYKPTEGKIIAELNFGFWTALFFEHYEISLFRPCLSGVFSNMPKHLRLRKNIHGFLERIRKFRNRVFHHEPIWKHTEHIPVLHNEILELIYWIDEPLYTLTNQLSSVGEVYKRGLDPYLALLIEKYS